MFGMMVVLLSVIPNPAPDLEVKVTDLELSYKSPKFFFYLSVYRYIMSFMYNWHDGRYTRYRGFTQNDDHPRVLLKETSYIHPSVFLGCDTGVKVTDLDFHHKIQTFCIKVYTELYYKDPLILFH